MAAAERTGLTRSPGLRQTCAGARAPLLHQAVAWHARARPTAEAVRDDQRGVTYAELLAAARGVAAALSRRGTRRLGLLVGNRVEHLVALVAGPLAGVELVPMDRRWAPVERARAVENFHVDTVLGEDGDEKTLPQVGPERWFDLDELWAEVPNGSDSPLVEPEDIHVIGATGGTTGRPKGVRISHRATATRALVQQLEFGFSRGGTFLCATPLFHGAGRGLCLGHLYQGARVVLHPRFDPERVRHEAGPATACFCVPTMVSRLREAAGPRLPEHFHLVVSGSAFDAEQRKRARDELGGLIFNYFASVDTGGIAVLGPDEEPNGPGDVGHPVFGTEIALRDEYGKDVPTGEIGQVWARGPSVASGYEGAELDGMQDWVTTRDTARRDEQGRIHLHGRLDDVVISGGVNVDPIEVEAALSEHPDVAGVAIAGVPDVTWGERVAAMLVPRPDATIALEDVEAWLSKRLAAYKHPRQLRIVAQLPTTSIGKVDRQRVRELLREDG